MSEQAYLPIPVEAAKQIAEQYGRTIVVVIGWDPSSNRTHVTTYGHSLDEKRWAAKAGELCVAALGIDASSARSHEDFRDRTAAAWAVEREVLLDALGKVSHLLATGNGDRDVLQQQVDAAILTAKGGPGHA